MPRQKFHKGISSATSLGSRVSSEGEMDTCLCVSEVKLGTRVSGRWKFLCSEGDFILTDGFNYLRLSVTEGADLRTRLRQGHYREARTNRSNITWWK